MSQNIDVLLLDKTTNNYSHWFTFPYEEGDKNSYKANTSIGAFFFGTKPHNENDRYMFCWGYNLFGSSKVPPQNITLKSVWDFYNTIGFNHKTKKWDFIDIAPPAELAV